MIVSRTWPWSLSPISLCSFSFSVLVTPSRRTSLRLEAQCHVLPAGEGTASEYRVKASEKGVRIVYLDLKLSLSYEEPSQEQKALHGLSITFNRGRLIHSQDSFLAGYEIKTFC